jgi:hypothetical protein
MGVLIVEHESLAVTRMKILMQAFPEVELAGLQGSPKRLRAKSLKQSLM